MASCRCDQSSPGCRPIACLGFYEVIHWKRNEHCLNNHNGTQQSHVGAQPLDRPIPATSTFSLPLAFVRSSFPSGWPIFQKLLYVTGEGANRPLSLITLFSSKTPSEILGGRVGRGGGKDTYLFLVQLLYLT